MAHYLKNSYIVNMGIKVRLINDTMYFNYSEVAN